MTGAPGIGHNSGKVKNDDIAESGIAAAELKSFVERIQRLNEEKKALTDDIKDVYLELKGRGFDSAVVRKLISDLGKDRSERQEFEAIYELYVNALGLDFML